MNAGDMIVIIGKYFNVRGIVFGRRRAVALSRFVCSVAGGE
jgi:hypothetical protein